MFSILLVIGLKLVLKVEFWVGIDLFSFILAKGFSSGLFILLFWVKSTLLLVWEIFGLELGLILELEFKLLIERVELEIFPVEIGTVVLVLISLILSLKEILLFGK